MRRLLVFAVALVCCSWPVAWGQPYPQTRGLPFRIDPTISGSQSGWHLNLPDGVWNWGEQATDIGGTNNFGMAGQATPFNFNIATWVYHVHNSAGGNLGAWHITGTMDGIDFRLTVPDEPSPPTPLATFLIGQGASPNYDLERTGIVLVRETRPRNTNSDVLWPLPIPSTWTGPAGTWPLRLEGELGATIVQTSGKVGGTPLVQAAQEAITFGKYFRSNSADLDHVYLQGLSFGSAIGLIASLAEPDVFDAIELGAMSLSLNGWKSFHDYRGMRNLAHGGFPWMDHDAPTWDGFSTYLGQYGLERYHLDMLRFPELFRTPMLGLNARDDWLLGVGALDNQFNAKMAAAGITWVEMFTLEEGGHGMPDFAVDAFDHRWQRLWALETQKPAPPHPMLPFPDPGYQRQTVHDEVNRHDRNLPPPTGLSLAWEVGAINDGVAVPPMTQRGLGTRISNAPANSSVIYDHGGEQALYSLTLEGFVTRHDWQGGSLVEIWREFVGLNPRSIAVDSINGFDQVVVGSLRGVSYLDAASGAAIAATSGKYDHIRAITIADLSAWDPSLGQGPHTMYVADAEVLVIEDRDHAVVLETPIGSVTRIRVRTEDNGSGPLPYLYTAMSRGHITRFRFEDIGGTWNVVADMISDYLVCQPLDFAFVDSANSACSAAPTTQIVTGGTEYDVAVGGIWLTTLDLNGAICSTIAVPGSRIDHVESDGLNRVLVGTSPNGDGAVGRVDISAANPSFALLANLRGAFSTGTLASPGDIAHFSERGDIRVMDTNGTLLDQIPGRTPTTAVDLTVSDTGGWELCVLDRDWFMRRYDATTGAYVDAINWAPPIRWTCGTPPNAYQSLPHTMVRRDANAFVPGSFELFDFTGTMTDVNGVAHRAAYMNGTVVVSQTKGDEHNALIGIGASSSGLTCTQAATGTPVYMHPQMAVGGGGETAIIDATFSAGDREIVFGNQSGNVWSLPVLPGATTNVPFTSAGPASLTNCGPVNTATFFARGRDLRSGVAGLIEPTRLGCQDISGLAVADVAGDAVNELIVGARLPDGNGDTLYIMDRIVDGYACNLAINAGAVSGLLVTDISGDGDVEIIVGTDEGRVRIYDQSLVEILSFDVNALAVGSRGAMWIVRESPDDAPILVFGHSEGVSAYTVTGTF